MQRINIYLPENIYEELKIKAVKQRTSMSALILKGLYPNYPNFTEALTHMSEKEEIKQTTTSKPMKPCRHGLTFCRECK